VPDKCLAYNSKYAAQRLKVPSYLENQFRYILSMLNYDKADIRILDLGGGTGEYSLVLQNLGYEVTLFDFSKIAIQKSREIGIHKTICADFSTYDFNSQKYEVVFSKGFSLLNTDNELLFNINLQKMLALLVPNGACIYWSVTDFSGGWTLTGSYRPTKVELQRHFDQVVIFPAFRYGCRFPKYINQFISRALFLLPKLPKPMTVIGIKFK
jgi:SAM-dependent methyltransferase